jgi:hypothetical protein
VRVKVVALLVGFVNLALSLLVRCGQFNEFSLVNVEVVDGVVVVWRGLDAVVDDTTLCYSETNTRRARRS